MAEPSRVELESDQLDPKTDLRRLIGQRVRDYRLQLGLTVAGLAKWSGLSNGMLSKIENAEAGPSLPTLVRIAAALDVPLAAFFDYYETHTVIHVKAGHGLDLPRGSRRGLRSKLLGDRRGQRKIEAVLHTLSRTAPVSERYRHRGTEFLYMLDGRMEFGYGTEHYLLEPGDALHIDGEVTHGPTRLVEVPVRFLSVKAYSSEATEGH